MGLAFPLKHLTRRRRSVTFPLWLFLARKSRLFFIIHAYRHTHGQINALESLSRCEHFRWSLSCLARVPTKRKFIRSRSSKISLCIRKLYPSFSLCFLSCNARESSAAIVTTYHDFKRMKVSLGLLYYSNYFSNFIAILFKDSNWNGIT